MKYPSVDSNSITSEALREGRSLRQGTDAGLNSCKYVMMRRETKSDKEKFPSTKQMFGAY